MGPFLMRTNVIDTADWRLVVPLRTPMALAGSRLTAVMTPISGGPSIAALDSAAGSIAWSADAQGLTGSLSLSVPVAARGGWLAAAQTTLVFDVHRTVAGSATDEWVGRSFVLVLPASDSALVRGRESFSPVLVAGQPNAPAVLPALAVGPQGPANTDYIDERVAELRALLLASLIPLPAQPEDGTVYGLQVVGGAFVPVRLDLSGTPAPPSFFRTLFFPPLF